MKALRNSLVWVAAALFLWACTNTAPDGAQATGTEEAATLPKGQSTVQDEVSKPNILQIALQSNDHTTLAQAVQAAGLEDVLVNAGPLTVFAPTNAAFEQLPEGTLDELLKPENKAKLARIIKFHASPGKYTVEMLRDGMQLFQATGHYIKVEKKGNDTYVHGAKILGSVEASNGIIHVVDKVLLPPEE